MDGSDGRGGCEGRGAGEAARVARTCCRVPTTIQRTAPTPHLCLHRRREVTGKAWRPMLCVTWQPRGPWQLQRGRGCGAKHWWRRWVGRGRSRGWRPWWHGRSRGGWSVSGDDGSLLLLCTLQLH